MPDSPDPPKVYPRLNRRLRFVMWLAFVGGPLMIAGGAYEYYRTSSLKSVGITIPAQLVDSSTLATGKGRTSYRITLDYKPQADAVT